MNQLAPRTNAPAPAPTSGGSRIVFDLMNPAAFQHIQRVAMMYASSPLFPDHLRKGGRDEAIANAVLVMNIADRLNEDPLTVAQNIYFVSGKPGWSAAYMRAKANQHGVFREPIDFEVEGEGEDLKVTATAKLAKTGKKVTATVSMAMAKKEGWTRNAKYQSMPEHMLKNRASTFLIRIHCPEVMVGVPSTTDEIEDTDAVMRDVTPDTSIYDEGGAQVEAQPEVEDAEEAEGADKEQEEHLLDKERDKEPPKPAVTGKAKAKAKAEKAAQQDPAQRDMLAGEPEPDLSRWHAIAKSVKTDLERSDGDLSGVCVFYSDRLVKMRAEAPDIFAQLEDDLGVSLAEYLP